MKSYVLKLKKICDRIAAKKVYNFPYAIARSVLAMSLLVTIGLSSKEVLFPEHLYSHSDIMYYLREYNLFFLFGYEHLWISQLMAISIMLIVISGYIPRITGILHWWVAASFIHSSMLIDGGDQIVAVLTFLLLPVTLMDNRINHWRGTISSPYKNFAAFCTFCLMELQVAIVYLQAGIEKPYKSEEWADGTAFYYWINHNVFGASDYLKYLLNPLLSNGFFVTAFTWGTIIFEILLFGLLFSSRKRRSSFLKYALIFHLMIILFHGLVSFFFAMAGALILYLVPKDLNKEAFFKILGLPIKTKKAIIISKSQQSVLDEKYPISEAELQL
ncbi:hypothetical protein GV828_07635 [Flavobacterium sp. NST-5]|uniref:HTTM-like domain-containing protein n=1 Tax=Flavobacterium ichthyis TaxID=2698827 RepID=A0ABW9ZE65_9FLAO|nr:sporulation-delaying protein SdpB family protein [Flavobacterium ichthyis]NBL65068.1 hypothetical protein [Flavobacterium ichthyis]